MTSGMEISDRRRAALLRAAAVLGRVRTGVLVGDDLAADANDARAEAALASFPDGAVAYRDDEPGLVKIQRGYTVLVVPNETPDAIVDVLFDLASAMGPGVRTPDEIGRIAAAAILDSKDRSRADAGGETE